MNTEKVLILEQEMVEKQIQHLKPRYLKEKNEFNKCTTAVERMDYFLNDKEEVAYIRTKIKTLEPSLRKSDEKAIEMRTSGNDSYKEGNYAAAVAFYNQSLAWGNSDEIVSLAYGNRSAALFALGVYKECLQDIDRALKHGYPGRLRAKLIKRKEDATKAQSSSKKVAKPYEIPQSEKNHLIQSARNCIEIQTSEKYGRQIVATRDIKIGEILAVEKPYAAIIQVDCSESSFCFCHECLEHCYNLIPCPHCHDRLYCSEMCKEKAFKNGHKYECLTLPYIDKLLFSVQVLFSLKVTVLAMNDENNDDTIYCSDRYKEISKLESHINKDPPEKMYFWAACCANAFTLINEKTELLREFEGCENRFKELFCQHLIMMKVNSVGLNISHGKMSAFGLGLYSLYSLFNHSCYPNVFWHNCASTMVVRAISTIKKGEQCFISYGPTFDDYGRNERQEKFQRVYKFSCRCVACEENWPKITYPVIYWHFQNMKQVKTKLHEIIRKLTGRERTPPSQEILSLRNVVIESYKLLDNEPE